jgi:hypothetical protein
LENTGRILKPFFYLSLRITAASIILLPPVYLYALSSVFSPFSEKNRFVQFCAVTACLLAARTIALEAQPWTLGKSFNDIQHL